MKPKTLPETKSEENKRAYAKRKAAKPGLVTHKTRFSEETRSLLKPIRRASHSKRNLNSSMQAPAETYVSNRVWIDTPEDRDEVAAILGRRSA